MFEFVSTVHRPARDGVDGGVVPAGIHRALRVLPSVVVFVQFEMKLSAARDHRSAKHPIVIVVWNALQDQVETLDPLAGIHAAVTRRRADGSPGSEGWIPDQRVTVPEAVYAYTSGAAYASGETELKGTLTPGKLADMVVLSRDIFEIDPVEILNTRVEMTFFDGSLVYPYAA